MNTRTTSMAALAVATTLVAVSPAADAATKTQTFDVTLKIIADCTIAAGNLDFGQSQGVLAAQLNVNSTITVTCTNTTPYSVGLDAGTGTGSTTSARVMSGTGGNTSKVSFNLYQTNGATNWGNNQGTDTKAGTGNGLAQALTVYGAVPVQSTPQPDTYKSTITATVYF